MPGKIIKLNGICKDLYGLTGISFKFLPRLEEVSPPLCSRKEFCKAKNFKKQRMLCQSIEITAINKLRKSNLKICRFKCGLAQFMLPIFKKDNLIGVVLTNKIKESSRFPLSRDSKQVYLKPRQIASLAAILNRCRAQLAENITLFQDSVPNSRDKVLIQRAKNYIEKNHHNSKLPLKDLAQEIHTSYFYLCRLFKKELKLSFIQYLSLVRLRAALKLLQNLNLTVAQVSYAVGFSDAQYFDRVFKKILKCRPKDYRLGSNFKREKIRQKVANFLC